MSEEFNWLDYAEPEESAPAPSTGRNLRRFLPRLPRRPRLPRLRRPSFRPHLPGLPRLPSLPRLPRLRRGGEPASERLSAADLLGVQDERPLEDLDDRLQSLRERSASGSAPEAETRQALYDVDEVLVSPEILSKPGGVISAAALSKAQQQQVELLKDIVGGAAQTDEARAGRLRASAPAFSLRAAPRIVVTAVLLLLVSLPFVSSDFSEGELPPSQFDEDRPAATTLFNLLDNLSRDDAVLVAFEYGPAAAGELDAIAELMLRHIVAQRAVPLIVSSNPIAIVHARNIIGKINRSVAASGHGLQHGVDYFILRYLPGGSLGLRELSENFADIARVSFKGELTGLQFDSLDDMTLIVVIAERAEDMRQWAEQVVPAVDSARLLAASAYGAAPLAQVYADSMDEIVGMLVGYRDAYTYAEKLEENFGELLPAAEAGRTVSEETPAGQGERSRADEAQVERARPTAIPPASETPLPTIAPLPTTTPRPTNTALPTATDPPTATATLETLLVVEVTSPQQVRIRRGPTTADDILQLARAGALFEVIGVNGDGSWYKIALANGIEGWIAEFLVEEKVVTKAEFAAGGGEASARNPDDRIFLRREIIASLGKNPPRYYQVNAPVVGDVPEYVLMRDRSAEVPRLEAMTFGTLAAVLAIAIGNVVAAFGALHRRRRGEKIE